MIINPCSAFHEHSDDTHHLDQHHADDAMPPQVTNDAPSVQPVTHDPISVDGQPGTPQTKVARAKGELGASFTAEDPVGLATNPPAHDNNKHLFWPIFGVVVGAAALGFAGFCMRRKQCCPALCYCRKGYGTPDSAKKTDAPMDSVENPETPNYNNIVKEALEHAVREEQQQIRDQRETEDTDSVTLSVGTPVAPRQEPELGVAAPPPFVAADAQHKSEDEEVCEEPPKNQEDTSNNLF